MHMVVTGRANRRFSALPDLENELALPVPDTQDVAAVGFQGGPVSRVWKGGGPRPGHNVAGLVGLAQELIDALLQKGAEEFETFSVHGRLS